MKRLTLVLGVACAALSLSPAAIAGAQQPRPDTNTPTLYAAQTIPSGSMSVGASTGYPSTRFQLIFGLADGFDLGIQPGITYSGHELAGYRQDVGLDFQVPIRIVLAEQSGFNVGLRIVPYFRIGEAAPAFSVGGNVGARFGIPLPKIFTLFVGPELSLGFASVGDEPNRTNGFDGSVFLAWGLECFFKDKWLFTNEWNAGGTFGSGGLNGDGLFRVWFGFGRLFR